MNLTKTYSLFCSLLVSQDEREGDSNVDATKLPAKEDTAPHVSFHNSHQALDHLAETYSPHTINLAKT